MPILLRPNNAQCLLPRPQLPRGARTTSSSTTIATTTTTTTLLLSFRFHPTTSHRFPPLLRPASSASNRWKTRQSADPYTRASKVSGLKSRAAYKLLEINERHRLFRPGATVVDLGYAPGSWSQVAVNRVRPGGRVVGIDVIPAQPPRGANALQGDFLRAETRERLREFLRDPEMGRVRGEYEGVQLGGEGGGRGLGSDGVGVDFWRDRGREETGQEVEEEGPGEERGTVPAEGGGVERDRVVDVVLSDMSAPWPLASHVWIKSVSNPYLRMMNTSGMTFRDHAGSMDLCLAALDFGYDTLVIGGHFLCKFYAGSEDHALEMRLKKLFDKVHRIKPDSSRKESKEAYFVALRRKADVPREVVFGDT